MQPVGVEGVSAWPAPATAIVVNVIQTRRRHRFMVAGYSRIKETLGSPSGVFFGGMKLPRGGFVQPTGFREQFTAITDAWALAQGIVDTVREPVLVLDKELRVIAASRSFYSTFKVSPQDTQGRLLYALGDGQWDIPKLRVLLENIIPDKGVMEGYEVEHEFPDLGQRTMCLNARQVFYEGGANTTILLGIEDVTAQRILGREKDELLRQFEESRAFAQA
jgi:PAS domain-containing protein